MTTGSLPWRDRLETDERELLKVMNQQRVSELKQTGADVRAEFLPVRAGNRGSHRRSRLTQRTVFIGAGRQASRPPVPAGSATFLSWVTAWHQWLNRVGRGHHGLLELRRCPAISRPLPVRRRGTQTPLPNKRLHPTAAAIPVSRRSSMLTRSAAAAAELRC